MFSVLMLNNTRGNLVVEVSYKYLCFIVVNVESVYCTEKHWINVLVKYILNHIQSELM
jgi:hypothetical protein